MQTSVGGGTPEWVTFWAKWPAGHFDPTTTDPDGNTRLEPSDETLVRTITSLIFVFEPTASPGISTAPVDIAWGTIAFDGGEFPEFYEGAIFDTSSLVAPPNPALDYNEDWIWRYNVGGMFTRESGANVSPFFQESKAKRKLPPDTGILAVVGVADFVSAGSHVAVFSYDWSIHMAVRSGYTA